MPKDIWYIQDTTTNQWLHNYETDLENCTWGTTLGAHDFGTEQAAQDAIDAWGQQPSGKFIGRNPPIH